MGILDQLKNVLDSKKHDDDTVAPADRDEIPEDTYTVQSGDTLWTIACSHYGDGESYLKIFEANKDLLESPEHILPGQELVLPKLQESSE